jgi:LPS sulfotransferase NodH
VVTQSSAEQGPQPLLIFGQGRTGSTLLESLLASTGHFCSRGEVLNTKKHGEAYSPLRLVEGERKRATDQRLLCHIKPTQLTVDRTRPVRDPRGFLRELDRRGWRFVHISRRNKFEHVLSNLVAQRRGYEKRNDTEEHLRIVVDCEDLLRRMESRFQQSEAEGSMLGSINRLEVVYEDDLLLPDLHQRTIDRILDEIGLESRPVSTVLRKVNAQRSSVLIVNYTEVAERLQNAGFSEYLYD